MNVCESHPCCCFLTSVVNKSHTRNSVLPLRRNWVKRERVFEDDVFIENTCLGIGSKNAGRNLNVDVVLRRSRCSPGQWFPETEYLRVSAIFVMGTSGIPPKLNYRSIKSYSLYTDSYTYDLYVNCS